MRNIKVILLLIMYLPLFFSSCSKDNETNNGGGDEKKKEDSIVIDLTDTQLMDLTQKTTFKYFWDYAQENSGAARERYLVSDPNFDKNTVTTGGSGFGLMSILVGMERGYVSKQEGFDRINKIVDFFDKADRFHGAWPHWLDGRTGRIIPFSQKDNGGDLVETALLVQGLIAVKEYYKAGTADHIALSQRANKLWEGVEWNWYTNNQNVLYWHWSPNYNFDINLKIDGFNECLIVYVLAAASPTYPINKQVYTTGWSRSGSIRSSSIKYGYPLVVRHNGNEEYGGPLFWSHYSFLGLNPKGLTDEYVNYEQVVTNHTKINYAYCVQNPKGYQGYSKNCWGLTASYSRNADGSLGYAAHSPFNDLGVISPTAAISSMPYTPKESMDALKYFYYNKSKLLGSAGFYDAFSPNYNFWTSQAYLAIDQGPIIIMIENYRTGLLWSLFMADPQVKDGLKKLGFQSPNL